MARSRIVNINNLQQFTAINLLSDPGVVGGPKVIPGGALLSIVWTLADGKIARNGIGMSVAAGWSPTTALANAAKAALVAGAQWSNLALFLAPTAQITRVELLDLRVANQPSVASDTPPTLGTSTGTALPSEVAAVLTLRTGTTGPGGRGRWYIPGWATNAIGAGDIIASTAVAALGAWTQNIAAAVTAAQGQIVLLRPARASYTGSTGTVHPARPAGFLPFTTVIVRDNHWDSQRRRGLK